MTKDHLTFLSNPLEIRQDDEVQKQSIKTEEVGIDDTEVKQRPPTVVTSCCTVKTEEVDTDDEEGDGTLANAKRRKSERTIMECSNCSTFKSIEKFSTKEWLRGQNNPDKRVYCRRCEEKILIRKQVGRKHEHLCIRINTKRNKSSNAKYICTVIPANTKKVTFLPSEMTLDGYTRESWSMPTDENHSVWQSTVLRCVVGEKKMTLFLDYLKERKKSAYGTFNLKDGTDGFFFVPYYQSSEGKFVCKYILGLGLGVGEDDQHDSVQTANEKEEDYISSSVLGSLLSAQGKTDHTLLVVPKGSVKPAPKLKFSPSRPKNTGRSRDWFGPKSFIKEAKDTTGACTKRGSNVLDIEYANNRMKAPCQDNRRTFSLPCES